MPEGRGYKNGTETGKAEGATEGQAEEGVVLFILATQSISDREVPWGRLLFHPKKSLTRKTEQCLTFPPPGSICAT